MKIIIALLGGFIWFMLLSVIFTLYWIKKEGKTLFEMESKEEIFELIGGHENALIDIIYIALSVMMAIGIYMIL